ncbi:MAG: DUF2079 domain-containing protein [Candidatus Rokuibacteriota bacterium]
MTEAREAAAPGRRLRAARLLDGLVVALLVVTLAWIVTGGVTLALGGRHVTLGRAEEPLAAAAVVALARHLILGYAPRLARPRRAVCWAAAAYAVLMGFIVLARHRAIQTHALDLGYYVQLVWNIGHGNGARVTLPPVHAWADHLSPVFYLAAPLAWVLPIAETLLLAQTLVYAAGALAVWAYARRRLDDERLAAAAAFVYLVNPSLHGMNVRDVHPTTLAVPLVIAAALAFDAGRPAWCAAALVVALAGREDAAVAGVGFGIWLATTRGRWRLGGGVAAACVLLLFVDVTLVMPHFRGAPYPHLARWPQLGHSLPEILVSLALPWKWLPVVLTGPKLVYLLAMLAPLAFLPLLAPRALAAAVPGLAMNLLNTDPVLFGYRTPYQAFVLPFLILAAVDGAALLRRRGLRPERALSVALFVGVLLTSRTANELMVTRWRLGPDQRAAYALMARIPARAPVSVNERLVPHLGARPEVYVFPTYVERAEYVLDLAESVARARPPGFEPVAREGIWALLRRTG